MMTKTGENFQKTTIDASNSPGAVSIFFGKTSIEKVKEIVRKRHSSFPGQYPHEDTEDYTSPGSVGKKAAFFDQYIRCSSLEKTAETSRFNNGGKSDNKINLAGSEEMSESITRDKYEDHASDLSKDLMFSTADESLSKDTKVASLALVSGSSINVYKVEQEKTLQHIGNENVPAAVYSLNSMASPADSAQIGSFEASHKHRKNKDDLNKNVSNFTLENKAVQLEDHLNRVFALGEECGEKHARKSFTNGTQMKISSDHKQEKSDGGYSASTESNSQDMLKESLQPKKTSRSFKKDQQSNLAVHKASLTSTSVNANLHKKELNGAPTTTRTTVPVGCSKTHVTVSSLAKRSAESQPSKPIIEAGNIRTSTDLHGRNKEITHNVSRTTCIKASSHAINGRLLKVKDCQQIPGRGISYKDAENTEKGKEEKFDQEIKEMRRRFMSTKATAQPTSYKEPKSGFEKNGFISTKSPKPGKICIDEPCSDPPAASQNKPKDHDRKNSNHFSKSSNMVRSPT